MSEGNIQISARELLLHIMRTEGYQADRDAFAVIRQIWNEDRPYALQMRKNLNVKIARELKREMQKGNKDAAQRLDDLNKEVFIFSAQDYFEDFMFALEWNRPPKERFYMPRRKVLRPLVNALQDLADDKLDELFISQPPRTGKALADDTPVLTRNGWKNHGDLAVGDEVIGLDGEFKKVLAVHPKCRLDVMMEFTSGEKIQCHENHEWVLKDRAFSRLKGPRLLTPKEIEGRAIEQGTPGKRKHRYIFQVPEHKYVVGEEKDLPVDPYTLGVWLGDGTNKSPSICNDAKDHAIIEKIIRNGNEPRWETRHKTTGVMYYGFGFRSALQKYGMCHSRKTSPKHIPSDYLTASVNQRLELLAGLIDTDGTFRKKENRYSFTTCEESLRDTFIELLATFGWRACVVTYAPVVSSSGVQGRKNTFCIGFNPDCEIPCALERKRNHVFSKKRAVALSKVSRVEPKQGNCITVEGGMYLAGRTMVPTHNSTTVMFYLLWNMCRDPERSNLYVSYSDIITNAMYSGLMEIIQDSYTYNLGEIFPFLQYPNKANGLTNAKEETIDFARKRRYHTLTCRSLYGTLNGATDCNGLLVSDDLISGIEEAMNRDRMVGAWQKVANNMLTRAKEKAKVLWVGTRWSLIDPIGLRQDILENDPRFRDRKYRILNMPALNEKDMSNFEYEYGVGFSTAHFHQIRAGFERNNDLASWNAQYMQMPIEREGTVFAPDDMRFYNGVLPEDEPDRKFMCVDPAWGGGDFVASPVCYQYGDDVYVVDVVYNNGDKKTTQPEIVYKAKKYDVRAMQIESTKTTASYKEGVEDLFRADQYRCQITTRFVPASKSKEQKIFDKAPDIREHFVFLEDGKRSKEYQMFMQNVFSFKITGKNKHDDAPDSLTMASDFAMFGYTNAIQVFKRPF